MNFINYKLDKCPHLSLASKKKKKRKKKELTTKPYNSNSAV